MVAVASNVPSAARNLACTRRLVPSDRVQTIRELPLESSATLGSYASRPGSETVVAERKVGVACAPATTNDVAARIDARTWHSATARLFNAKLSPLGENPCPPDGDGNRALRNASAVFV
jgi:hypothetical protein